MSARVILQPFANKGDRYNIPDTDSEDSVSIQNGFTQIYSTPMSKGGKPPTREEFNGIFNFIFQHLYDRQIGLTPLYDNRLNYVKYCNVRSETGTTYICIKENGPDTEFGVRNPIDNPEYWSGGGANSIEELYTNFVALQKVVDLHVKDNTNPHKVTKEQIGLGTLPNKVSNSIDLDDPNTLASSKAVHDLNEAIIKNLTGEAEGDAEIPDISKFINIIKQLVGHTLSVNADGKLLLDGKLVCDGTHVAPPEPGELHNNQTSFLTINENDPNFMDMLDKIPFRDGAMFTVAEGATPPEDVEDNGVRAAGYVNVPETSPAFDSTVESQNFANGALYSVVDGAPLPLDAVTIDDNFVGYVEDAEPGTKEFDEKADALDLQNGGMFTKVNTATPSENVESTNKTTRESQWQKLQL